VSRMLLSRVETVGARIGGLKPPAEPVSRRTFWVFQPLPIDPALRGAAELPGRLVQRVPLTAPPARNVTTWAARTAAEDLRG